MRQLNTLVAFGVFAVFVSSQDDQSTWVLSGVICVSVGIATIEIVNAIGNPEGNDYRQNMQRFHDAIDSGQTESAIEILTDRGIDTSTAGSAVLATMNISSRTVFR
ncbi:hypothetical protein NZK35_02980 [Stieleria sp. ICT_E10.1]|uniref:hypothetical protein n=1 Tax=Stieleria sedimenti TaxID=2976331 RepID=UPI0021808BA2|nr:hypothetical protein [Stieleria sedimenti]MCS7465635.1 hypothetical protein [Stieleria sedimenti]